MKRTWPLRRLQLVLQPVVGVPRLGERLLEALRCCCSGGMRLAQRPPAGFPLTRLGLLHRRPIYASVSVQAASAV